MPSRVRPHYAERRTVFLLAAVNFVALGSLTAPAVAGIPLKIDAIFPEEQRAMAFASVLVLGGFAALIASPLFGLLSDRTRGRFGRRRPWMLAGVVAGLLCIVAFAMADSYLAITISWVCAQFAFNATLASAAALLADTVPEGRRAAASGVFTAAAFIGMLPPLLLAALLPRQIDVVVLVMPLLAVFVVGFAMTITERPLRVVPSDAHESRTVPNEAVTFRFVPSAFAMVWVQRLAMQSAFSLASAFTIYLIIDRMASDRVAATPIAMTATMFGGAGVVIGAAVGGAWASRSQRYLSFLAFGALALAAGAAVRAFAGVPVVLWSAAVIGGVGVGVYLTVNLALAMRVIPAQRAGGYLGLLNMAETIPQVLGPVAAAALLHVGQGDPLSGASDNYLMLYVAAAFVALSTLLILPSLRRATHNTVSAEADPAYSTT